jgi:hypothetical protein
MAVLLGTTACGTRTEPPGAHAAAPGHPLPWLADGRLHDGEVTVPTEADRLVVSAGTTLVGLTDERRSRWWLLDHDRLVPLLDDAAAYVQPVLSADGGTAAWRSEVSSTPAGDQTSDVTWQLTAYDVPTRTVLGRTPVSRRVTCCDQGGAVVVAAVANDGRVALTDGGDQVWMWRAGDDPVPASWRDFGGRRALDEVVSPDETRSVGADLVVRDLRTGERTPLDLTADRRWAVRMWAVRMWADDSHVLVARASETGAPDVVSCDATTGACTPD